MAGSYTAHGSSPAAPQQRPQSFSTTPVINDRTVKYSLSIKSPTSPYPAVQSFIFPLSPQQVRYSPVAMANYYDVQGAADDFGVQRIMDFFGSAPPTIEISGTTGWKRHAMDGGQMTGIQSVLAVAELLEQFAKLNVQQMLNGNAALFTMEWYDYFLGRFWQVVPMGKQPLSQDRQEPLIVHYDFMLIGIRDLSRPMTTTTTDPVATAFQTPPAQAQQQTVTAVSGVIQATSGMTNSQALAALNALFPTPSPP